MKTSFSSRIFTLILGLIALVWIGCEKPEGAKPKSDELSGKAPEWAQNANIYEVNLRQYTPEGTFKAFEKHLPRLKEMGIDILWLMPIHPIGEKNRKGTLGSYYAVRDYKAVNPEHGSLADLRSLVNKAHSMDMYVILDWVANHTSWDNHLIESHPEWYTHNEKGEIIPPVPDWADVADLNYEEKGLWDYMIGAMEYWIAEADIDGYRCDVAEEVPMEFWQAATDTLRKIKHVFMLAEAEGPHLHHAGFHMTYGWEFHHLMNQIAKGEKGPADIWKYLETNRATYEEDAYRMNFTSNHDENSWNGTVFERLGDAVQPMAVLTMTMEGMPMVYSGQETGLNRRLAFFEKDVITTDSLAWSSHKLFDLYRNFLTFRQETSPLHTGGAGAPMEKVNLQGDERLFSFVRQDENWVVWVTLNFSDKSQKYTVRDGVPPGIYRNRVSEGQWEHREGEGYDIGPWGYTVAVSKVSP